VKSIFPGGTVANLKFGNKPKQKAVLGADINAVDRVRGSGLCPDETQGDPGTLWATANVHFNVKNEAGVSLRDFDKTVKCFNGKDRPTKFWVVFDASSCGPDGFEPGVHDITTTVTGDAGYNQRVQRIRCRE
jgi:hypothetical protein